MHAIRQYENGGPEVLRYEELPDPAPGPGQVRIDVHASGVHVLDTYLRTGWTSPVHTPRELPMTPGREVAGVVEAVGDDVDGALLGARVVVHLGMASGGYADKAIAAVESLHGVPDDLAFDVAVAAIGTGRTAVGILDQAPIAADDVVLVLSAAGGLGVLLVQEARRVGALVVGLAGGPDKVAVARAAGAQIAVDYRADGWDEIVAKELDDRVPTLVFDGAGGEAGPRAFALLGPGGRLLQYGGDPAMPYDDPSKTVQALIGPQLLARPGGLRSLESEALAHAVIGTRVPLVGSTFALSAASEAHRALEARETHGKVVLVPDAVLTRQQRRESSHWWAGDLLLG